MEILAMILRAIVELLVLAFGTALGIEIFMRWGSQMDRRVPAPGTLFQGS